VRSGRRRNAGSVVVYVRRSAPSDPTRFGFIVSKAVGNAVHRNLVTRRLRSVARDQLETRPVGLDVVVRALPGCAEVSWDTLHSHVSEAIDRGVSTL
jgi:ribonuclease P protein component